MKTIQQWTEELLLLSSVERGLLAEKLVESLEFDTDPQIEAMWADMAQQRLSDIREGKVVAIPGEEALAQIRKLLMP